MLSTIAAILIIAIVFFELYKIKKKYGVAWAEMLPVSLLERFKLTYLTVLNLSFIFSLISLQLTMWLFYYAGRYINLYQAIFAFWFFIILAICVTNYRFETYDKKIVLFLFYLLLVPTVLSSVNMGAFLEGSMVRIPEELPVFHIKAVLIGIKGTVIPFLLYFFLIITLNSLGKVYVFLKVIVYGALTASIYVTVELFNRLMNFWPPLWKAQILFLNKFSPSIIDRAEKFADINTAILRPTGINMDMHATGYLLISGFFIMLILGNKIFKSKKNIMFIQLIIFFGILFSTVKTYMVIAAGLILVLLYFNNRKYITSKFIDRQLMFVKILGMITLGITLYFFYDIFSHMFINQFGTGYGRAPYVNYTEGFTYYITDILPNLLINNPIEAFLGFGHDNRLSFTGEMHMLGIQLARTGLVGFYLFWAIYVRVALECFRTINILNKQNTDSALFVFGLIACLGLIASLMHYSPFNLNGSYIGALVLYIGHQSFNYNRKKNSIIYNGY